MLLCIVCAVECLSEWITNAWARCAALSDPGRYVRHLVRCRPARQSRRDRFSAQSSRHRPQTHSWRRRVGNPAASRSSTPTQTQSSTCSQASAAPATAPQHTCCSPASIDAAKADRKAAAGQGATDAGPRLRCACHCRAPRCTIMSFLQSRSATRDGQTCGRLMDYVC